MCVCCWRVFSYTDMVFFWISEKFLVQIFQNVLLIVQTVRQFLQRTSFVIVGVRKSLHFLYLLLLKTILQMLTLSYFKTWLILKAFWQFVFFYFSSKNTASPSVVSSRFFLGTLNCSGVSGSQNEHFAGSDLQVYSLLLPCGTGILNSRNIKC